MAEKLTDAERAETLPPLVDAGWSVVAGGDALEKAFVFRNFVEAFGWMTQVALWAEKWNHHPDWSNVYKTVEVTLSTHDAGGLTALDARLARKMDELAGEGRA